MKQFSKVVENIESQKYFKVNAQIELVFKADNEGEAGYLADSDLGSLENQVDFSISNISEITQGEFDKISQYANISENTSIKDSNLISVWDQRFGLRKPTMTEKMEFYHQMRKSGYDGASILNTLKDKISFYNR